MNENCMHSSLGAFIETLRKMRKITIAELALEAHISTKTYIHIKKGSMPRLSAYLSLIFYYFRDLEDEEIRRVINGWLDEWFKVRKKE